MLRIAAAATETCLILEMKPEYSWDIFASHILTNKATFKILAGSTETNVETQILMFQ